MTQHRPQGPAPIVTAEWQSAEMPGQRDALLALLFAEPSRTVEDVAA